MSMNIYLSATLTGTTASNKKVTQVEHFTCWPTPTAITRKILAAEDPLQCYINWVHEVSAPDSTLVYTLENDDGDEDPAAKHIAELNEWLDRDDEWVIEWYER